MSLNFNNLFMLLKDRGKAEELSKITGISSGNISDWKSGRSKPSIESISKIADVFGYSIDYLLGRTSIQKLNLPTDNIIYLPICPQRASAGIGVINASSNTDMMYKCFESSFIPKGTTHGIIIDGHSMEPKFFNKQIVFIQQGLECATSDCGIFSVTDYESTKIYCKQLMQSEDGSKYLHSINNDVGDPDIDYKNIINIHCIGKILI